MKKIIFTYLILCLSVSVNAQNNSQKEVESHLTVIENYLKLYEKIERENDTTTGISMDKIIESAIFLEELTGIKSHSIQQFVEWYTPSRKNLRNWKSWYRKNKNKLYWDEKENKIRKKK